MAVPMYLLFEGGILFAAILQKGSATAGESNPEQSST
jgi:Sec-independent protein secretion pathway component TatC